MATQLRRQRKTYKPHRLRHQRSAGTPTGGKVKKPAHEKTNKNPIANVYLCAVPSKECSGSKQSDGGSVHGSPEAVLRCKGNWLIRNKYKKINSREYICPDTGSILVLTNKPLRVKRGKATLFMTKNSRIATW